MGNPETLAEGTGRHKSGPLPDKTMGYWRPACRPRDTDVIAQFRIVPQTGAAPHGQPLPLPG